MPATTATGAAFKGGRLPKDEERPPLPVPHSESLGAAVVEAPAPVAGEPPRRPPYDWARARGTLSIATERERPERSPRERDRDRRAQGELRRLARDLVDIDADGVAQRLEAIAAQYAGGAA